MTARSDAPDESTILIVDDDDQVRSTLAKLLARIGLEVRQESSGERGLAAARAQRPDLVILDVHLPDISGYELCRELRLQFGDELPIVMVSGMKTDGLDRSAGLLLGADDFVVKPVDVDDLRARVRRLLARGPRHSKPAAAPHDLTHRELEVLGLLVAGNKPAQIAAELVLSPKTVSTHLQHIFAKLGVNSQGQAVAVALRDQLVG